MNWIHNGVIALALGLAIGCSKSGGNEEPSSPPRVTGVTVGTVTSRGIPETIEAVGSLKARESAAIAARISGTVTRVYIAEGSPVAKGALLLTIDSPETGAASAGALSGVQEAERGVFEAQARKKLADATFDRFEKLYKEEAVTRQEFEQRQMEQETAAQGVARAEARLAQARQGAKGAGAIAGYARVTSPISGVVTSKQVEPGQTVFPNMPLLTIEGERGLRLEVAVPEGALGKVKVGDVVPVVLEGAHGSGRISEIVPVVDPASRTFLVKIDTSGRSLRSGSYGKALFHVGTRPGFAVPRSAVVERGGLTSVWAVSAQGIARLRLVRLGRETGEIVEVISGLGAGDRIVTGGTEKVADGTKVL
ncbi:efflux RND transporter periplasmic adaptor subunit [Geomonas sp. RF6]|uniref:efflux RND transporter periplasmic adaptor subunit n=1 Tax=Geomonas sp. RF6 TaxID=2897342 RepID=UPI001E437507|nr:efflux RND transporter periplasmic adaptor subunit [Geomonas sp. RF6]UFS69987.1 efflux RND transporter periplasmic adaptor subunit [Geomonas sp. RF6]